MIQETTHAEITLLGDFNVNFNLRHTQSFKLLKQFDRDLKLTQEMNTSTRIINTASTCIDLIFTNMEYVISKGTIDSHISDHLPVYIIKEKDRESNNTTTFWGRSYVRYNYQNDIRNHYKWGNYWTTNEENSDELWELILESITEVVDFANQKISKTWQNNVQKD